MKITVNCKLCGEEFEGEQTSDVTGELKDHMENHKETEA